MICMAELTQAEKTKYWSDIKLQWKIVKEGKNGDVPMAQQQINILQEKLGVEVTDFNKVNEETPTQEVEEYTLAKAEEIIGEENLKIIEEGVDFAIAYKMISADLTIKKFPKLRGNNAGIGQMVNISYDRIKGKLK
jgi:hypothetical protein